MIPHSSDLKCPGWCECVDSISFYVFETVSCLRCPGSLEFLSSNDPSAPAFWVSETTDELLHLYQDSALQSGKPEGRDGRFSASCLRCESSLSAWPESSITWKTGNSDPWLCLCPILECTTSCQHPRSLLPRWPRCELCYSPMSSQPWWTEPFPLSSCPVRYLVIATKINGCSVSSNEVHGLLLRFLQEVPKSCWHRHGQIHLAVSGWEGGKEVKELKL